MSHKILFISRDPGGTNQLVALYHILSGPDSEVRAALFADLDLIHMPEITLMAKDYALKIWQQNGIGAGTLRASPSEKYLSGFDQVISSTCHVDDRTEQSVWRMAKKLGVKTTAFLDSGHNMDVRFTGDMGEVIFPDRISVIDEKSIELLCVLGFARNRIFVSGDLYLNYLRQKKKTVRQPGRGCQILFASDYIREMQAMGVTFEITEFDCLASLLGLLKSGKISEYVEGCHPPYHLIIRPHPKDIPGKYDAYPGQGDDHLTISICDEGVGADAVLACDLVAGLGSSLMTEARALSVPVLALGAIVRHYKDQGKTAS